MFTIYGKDECPMCFKMKTVLELLGKEYEYLELEKDYTEEEFEEKFPDVLSLPQVVLDGKHLGDANQTLKYLKEHRVI
tara:strand:- start:3319 stop:3552 length:234 start_codon:yes stop_codon:yes gene_type:complete